MQHCNFTRWIDIATSIHWERPRCYPRGGAGEKGWKGWKSKDGGGAHVPRPSPELVFLVYIDL